MALIARRPFGQNYAWVVVGATFVSLLAAAGLRAAPSVLMNWMSPCTVCLDRETTFAERGCSTRQILPALWFPFG